MDQSAGSAWSDVGSSSTHRGRASDFATFDVMYPALRRFAAVVADLDMDPDDLVQDALASTLRRTSLSELDKPVAYLKRTIVHVAANKRRSAGRLRSLLPRLAEPYVSTDVYPSDLALLDTLSPLDRAVIFMADIEGEPHDQIASQLGMTPAAVRKRASRARKQLRNIVQPNITSITPDAVNHSPDDPASKGST